MEYLKKTERDRVKEDWETAGIVRSILEDVSSRGEQAVKEYSRKLDGYEGRIVATPEDVEKATRVLPESLKEDIRFAKERVGDFALRQKDSLVEFECEPYPGMKAGQKLIPIDCAGCYVPGGRYAHIASAVMGVATAKVAGVRHVTACSSPKDAAGMHPAVLYAMHLSGADAILHLGGVQALASMAEGLFGVPQAAFIVGPGNRFVTEAKRILFGKLGIDQIAGPTEILVIADESADPEMVAVDLVSQAEHGPDSPVWLVSTSKPLAEKVMARVPVLIRELPHDQAKTAETAWQNHGEVAVCSTREEAVELSDAYAPEHLEIHVEEEDWYAERLKNYGTLFIGEETTVSYGDKCSGTNHVLPTRAASAYTGGLCAQKFLKIVTWQRMNRKASVVIGEKTANISRHEGMEAHARSGDARIRKYRPNP